MKLERDHHTASPIPLRANASCLARTLDLCGEGAAWHPQQDAVYWTDINRRLLHRFGVVEADLRTWSFDQPVTAVTLTSDPALLVLVLGGRIVLWDTAAEREARTLYTLKDFPRVRFNEARVDPAGVLWAGTMQNNVRADGTTSEVTEHLGKLLSIDSAGHVEVWHDGLGISNTLVWSPDGTQMYFGDTLRNAIYRFAFDPAHSRASFAGSFAEGFERGLPDGSAIDVEGHVWNCRYGGGCIVRFAPDGRPVEIYETPVRNPTTCTFGGPDGKSLYFTSAAEDPNNPGAHAGSLFHMRTGVVGLPANVFRL